MRGGILLALALMVGLVAPAAGPTSAFADGSVPNTGLGVRLVDAPTATRDDPRARVYIIDHLASEQSIKRRVEVANNTASSIRASVYPGAATLSGGTFVGAAGQGQNDLTTWTSTTPSSLRLAPHQKAFVMVEIRIPAHTPPGERYGVVWAQTASKPGSGGVAQVSRVGIRLYLSVGTGTAPKSDFEIVSMAPGRDQDRTPIVTATIRNTGQRALDLSGSLSLAQGPAGLSGGPFPVTLGTTLAIGATEPVLVRLDPKLPNGPWLAQLTVRSGVTSRTSHARLTFPSEPGQNAAVPVDRSAITWWMIALGVVVLLLLVLLGVVIRLVRSGGRAGITRRRTRSAPDRA